MSHYRHAIDAETRGRLRRFKAGAAARYAKLDRMVDGERLREDASILVLKKNEVARHRGFQRIASRVAPTGAVLEGVRLAGKFPLAVWSILKPREAVVVPYDEGQTLPPAIQQDCVCVNYLLTGTHPDRVSCSSEGLWTLEVFDHALGRMMQRHPDAEPESVIRHAHHAALRLKGSEVGVGRGSFLLPAGQGAFVAELVMAEDMSLDNAVSIHVQCHTWLHEDQLRADQTPLIDSGEPGQRLGDHMLLPAPLRRIVSESVDLARGTQHLGVSVWAPGMPETMARPMGRA